MVIVVALVVVLVVVGAAAWALNRRQSDEVHSVEGYRHTLDTLHDMRSRSANGSVRVLESSAGPGGGGRAGLGGDIEQSEEVDPVAGPPANGTGAAAPGNPPGSDGAGLEDLAVSLSLSPRAGRRQARAMSAMNHRPRHLGAPIVVAVAVLALLGLVILAGLHSKSPHHSTKTATNTPGPTAAPKARTPATGGHVTKPHASAHQPPVPTTPIPTSYTATSSTASTATYKPPTAAYALTLSTTSGACWVKVTSGGITVFTKTMPAGQQQLLNVNGSTTVELGAPGAISVQLDHLPVTLPTGYQSPFTLTLSP